MDNVERFWKKVTKTNGCWLWNAGVGLRGYGVFHLNGATRSAHRVSYLWAVGPIPDGMQIDHLCGQKTCVRPDHLEAVTPRTNTLRAANAPAAINARKTHCWRGHPLSGPEADIYDQGPRRRACRTCNLIAQRLRRAG